MTTQGSLTYLKGLGQTADRRKNEAQSSLLSTRPATALEVARTLPRRSWLNVYASRGVATAVVAAATTAARTTKEPHGEGDYRAAPPALPAWHANDPTTTTTTTAKLDQTQDDDDNSNAAESFASAYKWQEYFLDLGEDRAAAQLQKEKRKARREEARSMPDDNTTTAPKSADPPLLPQQQQPTVTVDSSEPETATESKEQRQARIANLAAALDNCFRAERKQKLAAANAAAAAEDKEDKEGKEETNPSWFVSGSSPVAVRGVSSSSSYCRRSWSDELKAADLAAKWSRRLGPEQASRVASLVVGPGTAGSSCSDGKEEDTTDKKELVPLEQLRALADKYNVPLDQLAAKRRQWQARQANTGEKEK